MKIDLTKQARTALAGRHEPEGIRVLASLYWSVLLVLSFFIVMAVLIYGILGLLRILHDLNGTENLSTPPSSGLNRTELKEVLEGFENRAAQFEFLKTTRGASVPDPSR
ncbi:hypothetical protein COU18_00070 [Candidatus Kaiserbacteria bacterium CG10_big_fil_rev_8_21_14_0_10_51_14]|uniref:Uncharacterized protein n=1 Tax=Candidatus Kaiserbacteria bacterium CG10_big_fil_rev_8_21_14_0_10_51_14 TaxID=1974610 RepID=A0A2H0UCL5_9BACT|nr:MAG: hypothetical protein COU18_00070 [Candidatus Kaiserbacteria bacterium CG10_big_fil_rev_8_21_14_0_10_51_14]